MGFAGRSRVEAHFDIRQTVAAYEALYQEVAEAQANKSWFRSTSQRRRVQESLAASGAD
jgi:hypothetical protein